MYLDFGTVLVGTEKTLSVDISNIAGENAPAGVLKSLEVSNSAFTCEAAGRFLYPFLPVMAQR